MNSEPSSIAAKAGVYARFFGITPGEGVEDRLRNYADLANHYYDLVTGFYRLGWGESFHFAPLQPGRSLGQCLTDLENRLARRLGVDRDSTILDVGCGIGGPMRQILRSAKVFGFNVV